MIKKNNFGEDSRFLILMNDCVLNVHEYENLVKVSCEII